MSKIVYMDKDTAYFHVKRLYAALSNREGKYTRNLNRYNSNGDRRESIWTLSSRPQTYWSRAEQTEGVETQVNVLRSLVNTMVSKISQAKVRPFINPTGGDWDTRKAARNAQLFFDTYLEEADAYGKTVEALTSGAIFEMGSVWWDECAGELVTLNPWEVYKDPAEYNFGKVTMSMVYRREYPLVALADKIKGTAFEGKLAASRTASGQYAVFYDLLDGQRFDFFEGELIKETKLNFERIRGLMWDPVRLYWYQNPIKGFHSVSLLDEAYTIQRQIDEMQVRIDAASRNGLTQVIMVPKGAQVKASQLSNVPGVILEYTPGPDGGAPTTVTPPAINPQFIELLNMYESKAYQLSGVSVLSAQSKKPAGANSGVALQTLEDVESERFEVQLQKYIRFMVEICKTMIYCADEKTLVLPDKLGRAKVTWGQVRKQKNAFEVQFSAGSSLAKDPATKLLQIEKLIELGFIDKDLASSFLELPDLEGAYSASTAGLDYVEKIIQRAAEDGDTDFVETVPLGLLMKETVKTINRLEATDEKPEVIDRLVALLEKVDQIIGEAKNSQAPMPGPVALPPVIPPPGAV